MNCKIQQNLFSESQKQVATCNLMLNTESAKGQMYNLRSGSGFFFLYLWIISSMTLPFMGGF